MNNPKLTDNRSKTIVWIEDDTDIIYPVVRPLERAGYLFIRLRTASEALELEAVEQIRNADLILLDMLLPAGKTEPVVGEYSGKDILYQLRKVHGVTTPVVIFTVVINTTLLHQLEELNVADIVRKPVRPSELKERVEKALGL